MVEAKRAKKAAPKTNKNLTLEERVEALEAKVAKSCNMVDGAKDCCTGWCDKVKGEYAKNPGRTVAIGAGVIVVLLLLFK